MLPHSARSVVESNTLAHVVTLDPDGSPYVTLAWAGIDGDEVVLATLVEQRKLRNLRRDRRIALSFETNVTNQHGLREYLVIYGTARVSEGGAPELLQELARTYLGPDVQFPPMPEPPAGYVTHVTVDRFGGVGPWRA